MNKNYDVAIIGGGIVGSALAAHLANENLKVVVLKSENLGTPASIAAAGLLSPFQIDELENPLLKDLCFKSFEYLPQFIENILSSPSNSNIDLGYRKSGSLFLLFSNFEFAKKENEIKEIKELEPNVQFVNRVDIEKYEPLLTKEAIGAYHFPSEGYINNPKFLKSVWNSCMYNKVDFLNKKVTRLNMKANVVESISLEDGENIQSKTFVIANGVWANTFLKDLFNLKEDIVSAIKGEIIQLESTEEKIINKVIFCSEGYITPRPKTNNFETSSILVGSTSELIDIKTNKDPYSASINGLSSLLNLFKKLIPSHNNFHLSNKWSGLRPQTKDKLPAIGKIPGLENLFCSIGHYRNGILMSAFSGMILKDIILGNSMEYNIEPFKVDRFLELKNKEPLFTR